MPMSLTPKQLIRIARSTRDQLLCHERHQWRVTQNRLAGLDQSLQRFHGVHRKLTICELRGWYGAARRLRYGIESISRDIPFHLQELSQNLPKPNHTVPQLAEIHRDLCQVQAEFGGLRHYAEGDLLCVQTDAIELNGVHLGEFEIQLQLASLAELQHGRIFRIIALDPHPASTNDSVTHPHVSDEQLCPGNAGAAINMALADGRICDFFLLVRSVLTTYNPDSPYVALENWFGQSCSDCGYTISEDDLYWCRTCEQDFCPDCSTCCTCCDETVCLGCARQCEACEETVCPRCLIECPDCGRSICKSCLDECLCPCHEEGKEEDDEESTEEEHADAARTEAA